MIRRRCRREDAIFGLGEKSGSHNRRGRDFTLWNTDVLDPKASGEFTAGRPDADPRSDRTSTEFDPYYVSIPFFYHQSHPSGAMAGSFVDNGYRAHYDFSGPGMPAILEAYTWLTGRTAPPPLWALGYHQCRWFDYTADTLEALAKRLLDEGIPCDALWLDIDHRTATGSSRGTPGTFPTSPACSPGSPGRASG